MITLAIAGTFFLIFGSFAAADSEATPERPRAEPLLVCVGSCGGLRLIAMCAVTVLASTTALGTGVGAGVPSGSLSISSGTGWLSGAAVGTIDF